MKITKVVPRLVKAAGTYWGEHFFVEVRTDEGVTGWGEITTTTKMPTAPSRASFANSMTFSSVKTFLDRAAPAEDLPRVHLHRFTRRDDQPT